MTRDCECNWLPLSAMTRTYHGPEGDEAMLKVMCRMPCVQEFSVTAVTQMVRMHRCVDHKVTDEFIGRLRQAERR